MTQLAAILAERGISQYELARRTRLTGPTVAKAYHGRGVSFRTWAKIATALDVELADLISDAGPSQSTPYMTTPSDDDARAQEELSGADHAVPTPAGHAGAGFSERARRDTAP